MQPMLNQVPLAPPPPDPSAVRIAQYNTVWQRAGNVAQGKPPVEPPPPPPVPPPVREIGAKQIQGIGDMLEKLPPDKRAEAIIQAHDSISKTLLQQGKVVVNGKLEVIKTPEQADTVAKGLINGEIDRRDQVAADAEKEAKKPAKAQPEAVKQPSSRSKAAGLSQPTLEVAEAPQRFEVAEREPPEKAIASVQPSTVESANASLPKSANETPQASPATASEILPAGSDADKLNGTGVQIREAVGSDRGSVAPADQTLSKGDPVTFSKNMQVAKGEGKSEIIRVGTKAFVEHSNPDMNFARVRMADGKVQSVPLRYLEAGHGQEAPAIPGKPESGTISKGTGVDEKAPTQEKSANEVAAKVDVSRETPSKRPSGSTWDNLNDDIRKRSWS